MCWMRLTKKLSMGHSQLRVTANATKLKNWQSKAATTYRKIKNTENLGSSTGVDHLDAYDVQELTGQSEINEKLIKDLCKVCIVYSSKKSYSYAWCTFVLHYWEQNKSMLNITW